MKEKEQTIKENEEKIAKLEAIRNWQLEKLNLSNMEQNTQNTLTKLKKLLTQNEQKNHDRGISF